MGEWGLVYDPNPNLPEGWYSELEFDRQEGPYIYGKFQVDTAYENYTKVSGVIWEGTPRFGFDGYDWRWGVQYSFDCLMRPGERKFVGRMDAIGPDIVVPHSFTARKK